MAQQVGGVFIGLDLAAQGFNSKIDLANRRVGQFGVGANRHLSTVGRQANFTTAALARLNQTKLGGIAAQLGGLAAFRNPLSSLFAGLTSATGLAAIVSVGGAIGTVKASITGLAQTASEAQRAGLSGTMFQELRFAAEQSRIGVDALTDGMKELQLRADEFAVTGKGSAAEAFQRIGMSREEVKERLRDPADMLNEIINRVGKLSTAARVRILDELFGGTAGEQFIRFIEQGQNGVQRLRDEARRAGVVLSDEVLARAVEIDRRFNLLSQTIGTRVKGAVVAVIDDLSRFMAMLPGGEIAIDKIGERSIAITREIIDWENQLADARATAAATGLEVDKQRVGVIEQRIAALHAEDRLLQARGRAAVEERDRRNAFTVPTGGDYKGGATVPDESATRAAEQAVKAYASIRSAAQSRINQLQAEQAALGLTTAEAERLRFETDLLNAANRRGLDLSPKQRSELSALADEYAAVSASLETVAERHHFALSAADAFTSSISGFASDLRSGTDEADAFASAVSRLTDRLLDLVAEASLAPVSKLLSGAIGGLFSGGGFGGGAGPIPVVGAAGGLAVPTFMAKGGVFGPSGNLTAFARGGVVSSPITFPFKNGTGLMGEAGPEAIMPLTRGPGGKLGVQAVGGGGGGDVIINNYSNAQVTAEKRPNPNGGAPNLVVMIEDVVAGSIASGQGRINKAMQNKYGLDPMRGSVG